ncbi:TetR/AcrR family transcriptional regulator [Neobacillus niacini]|uniref:TetR/AcrR family transcriptional regulator n=1 Tax=Neobacillus niacini TaxID=86668 RepID=UPI0021CB72EB|nr:TetR/AcrR family transcriptional regulator [Neobacillus niacini]MCM3764713.1 TetR/AcrR family transcriptional regulator [Neobacillus niacini]
MNERKQHVLRKAHQLFIEKGFQATSIQDILEYSGISKGTFYNYFSSKNELLIAVCKKSVADLEKMRDDLLIGQSPSDIEVFIKQIELQLKLNRKNNLITLFEELMFSDDKDMKQFFKKGQIKNIRWLYQRFIDLFGEEKKLFLLDCAIMFMGTLRDNLRYSNLAYQSNTNIAEVVRYTVNRLVKIVDEVSEANEQLIAPETLETWLPSKKPGPSFKKELHHLVASLKNSLPGTDQQESQTELLSFIEEELLDSKNPRRFLIESTMAALTSLGDPIWENNLRQLKRLIADYFIKIEEMKENG